MGVGSRIRQLREMKKLKQSDLAKMIGVTPSAVGNYENEISHPKVDILYKICKALDCDANYLFQDDVDIKTSTSLTIDEKNLINDYRTLSDQGKEYIRQTMLVAKKAYREIDDSIGWTLPVVARNGENGTVTLSKEQTKKAQEFIEKNYPELL
ncbi:MAG: helix-turn-helix domain-containing protein [Candidatus Ornithomonoglobus sp.]